MSWSKKLSRLLKRHLGTEDVAPLLADAERGAFVEKLASAFPAFLDAIDAQYAELDDRNKVANRNLEISSAELNQRNLEFERLNLSMQAILESQEQGLVFFDKNGVCAPVYSRACLKLLEKDPSGRQVTEVLGLDADTAGQMRSLIDILFGKGTTALSFDDLFELAPKSYAHGRGLHVALSYRAMLGMRGDTVGVLVIATDITREVAARALLAEKERQVVRILRIARDRSGFTRYLRSLEAAFGTTAAGRPLSDIRREIHTQKGMARVFLLEGIAELLHTVEDEIAVAAKKPLSKNSGASSLDVAFGAIAARHQPQLAVLLEEARHYGRDLWGCDFETAGAFLTVESGKLIDFARTLETMPSSPASRGEILELYFDRVAAVPVGELLGTFEAQLNYFAEMADKPVEVNIEGGNAVGIFPDFYRDFFDTFVHIARNTVDHAFDSMEARRMAHKHPALQVRVTVMAGAGHKFFTITIADDGAGIDAARVRTRLKGKMPAPELDAMKHDALIQHIFDDDVSALDAAGLDAGRGVGLAAVRAEALKLGGEIIVTSTPGAGTAIRVTLPLLRAPHRKTA